MNDKKQFFTDGKGNRRCPWCCRMGHTLKCCGQKKKPKVKLRDQIKWEQENRAKRTGIDEKKKETEKGKQKSLKKIFNAFNRMQKRESGPKKDFAGTVDETEQPEEVTWED